jgi:arylsulfatase A
MQKNQITQSALAAMLIVGAVCSSCVRQPEHVPDRPEKPNFIIIFNDDLGYGDVGSAGSKLINTPNIDRMEREGVRLTNHYSSAHVCTPSRTGLLTGRYPIRSGMAHGVLFPNSDRGLPHDEVTMSSALKEVGYNTAIFGKWHLGTVDVSWPTQHGFDYFYGIPYSNDMVPLPMYENTVVIEEELNQQDITRRLTLAAVDYIHKFAAEPFLVYLAHPMPHVPLFASEAFEGVSAAGLYGDVIEEIDWSLGEILQALSDAGIDDRTMVIFTSDNGPWFEGSTGGLRERKGGASYEGGFNVPFIVRWPGQLPAGHVSDAISMNFDVFPTLLTLAGVRIPDDRIIDGKDIWPVLAENADTPHEFLYFFDNERITAIRTQRWKFVVYSRYRDWLSLFQGEHRGSRHYYHPGLLFDLETDPEEQYSFTRENPEVVARMLEILDKGREELEVLGIAAQP